MNRRDHIRGRRHDKNDSTSGGTLKLVLVLITLFSLGFSVFLYQEKQSNLGEIASLESSRNVQLININSLKKTINNQKVDIDNLKKELSYIDKIWTEEINKNSQLRTEIKILESSNKPSGEMGMFPSNSVIDELNSKNQIISTLKQEISSLKNYIETGTLKPEEESKAVWSPSNPYLRKNERRQESDKINCTITRAKLIGLRRPAPIYPKRAIDRNIQGTVKLSLGVSTNGSPMNIIVLSTPDELLSKSAITAAKKMRFTPSQDCNGNKLIDRDLTVSYSFKMD